MLITMAVEGTNTKTGDSGAMTITTDTWMANVPGYDEVKNFHKRMAEKMGYLFGSDMAQMGMMRPDVGKGFEQVRRKWGSWMGFRWRVLSRSVERQTALLIALQVPTSVRNNNSNSSRPAPRQLLAPRWAGSPAVWVDS